MDDKVLKWKCPECDKVLKSLYKVQLEQFKESHLATHKKGEHQ